VALQQVVLQLVEASPMEQRPVALAAALQMVTPTVELAGTLLAALELEQAALVVQEVIQAIPLLMVAQAVHLLL
jgi:hypothetical protein